MNPSTHDLIRRLVAALRDWQLGGAPPDDGGDAALIEEAEALLKRLELERHLEQERQELADWLRLQGVTDCSRLLFRRAADLLEGFPKRAVDPPEPDRSPAPSAVVAYAMGATGAPPSEEERLAFEAWMSGHCWLVSGDWDGTTYVTQQEREKPGWVDNRAMLTRELWAAWRDRAALAQGQEAQRNYRAEAAPIAAWVIEQTMWQEDGWNWREMRDALTKAYPFDPANKVARQCWQEEVVEQLKKRDLDPNQCPIKDDQREQFFVPPAPSTRHRSN